MLDKLNIETFPCSLIHETNDAYLINPDLGPKEGEQIWIPKSVCEYDPHDHTMQIEIWFAKKIELF